VARVSVKKYFIAGMKAQKPFFLLDDNIEQTQTPKQQSIELRPYTTF
jgi:hypothetical protein